ncbi:MAG: PDZ domain-containing protein, partial [Burkholderiales bacterium]
VTLGIVSALGRGLGINTFESFIQTDAAINPGNSGGALVDVEGNLIGINSNIYSRTGGSEGIGFAIPVTIARQVMESIIRDGSVTRGWMGIDVQEMNAQIAAAFGLPKPAGVLVARILRGGPADRGGLQVRDVILQIDGKDINDAAALLNTIAAIPPGRAVPVKVWRAGKNAVLTVEVGKRPSTR